MQIFNCSHKLRHYFGFKLRYSLFLGIKIFLDLELRFRNKKPLKDNMMKIFFHICSIFIFD